MTIWDSICHSQWFKQTSIVRIYCLRNEAFVLTHQICLPQILFLNKEDLFDQRIKHSDVKNFFPVRSIAAILCAAVHSLCAQDYDGEPGDAEAGKSYFKKRFARLAQKANQKEREIYIQCVPLRLRLAPAAAGMEADCLRPFKHYNSDGYCYATSRNGSCRRLVYSLFSLAAHDLTVLSSE